MNEFVGPRAKVKRAKKQLITLQRTFQGFFKENPYSIILAEFNRKTGYQYVRIKDAPTLPDEWGVIIGEIVHNLRSALDLLAWRMKCVNVDDSDTTVQFPIYEIGRTTTNRSSFWDYKKGRWVGNRHIKNVDRKFWGKLESFQPYKRGNKRRRNPLFLLQNLNNTDKHRLITVLGSWAVGTSFQGMIGGGSKFKVGVPLYPNAIIGHIYPLKSDALILDFSNGQPRIKKTREVQVNLEITPGIRFGDGCNAVKGFPVIPILSSLLSEVSRIIESFVDDF